MKKIIIIVLFLLGITGVFSLKKTHFLDHLKHKKSDTQKKETYFCPMHPSIVSDKPGNCPICHMSLQSREETPPKPAKEKLEKKILFYRHPMRPEITSPEPAKDEMGMDYIPIYEEEESKPSDVSGRATFSLSQERQQLIGVATTKVTLRELETEIRANGKVAFDPDLFTAIEEYLQALRSSSELSKSTFKELREQAQELISSSETKLKLMGLGQEQIRILAEKKISPMNLLLPEGSVWIYAEVFEYEMAGVKRGQTIEVVAPSIPGKTFSGTISSVSPILDTPTRTFRVRGEVPDSENLLRPDTFVNVKIKINLGKKIAIPFDSVLHAGDKNFVFVVKEKGIFEPKSVTVGVKTKDYYEVIGGLKEGEEVVTGANFLIDSESRLRSVLKEIKDEPNKPMEHHH